VKEDVTEQAKLILCAIIQVRRKIGYDLGPAIIARMLRGSKDKRIMELRLDELTTYGQLRDRSRLQIKAMMDVLESQGYLQIHPAYGCVYPTERAREVLYDGKSVAMNVRKEEQPLVTAVQHNRTDEGLLRALKDLRLQLAKEANVPAYIVFTNAALQDMAQKAPDTMEAFLEVSGVGRVKAERYGEVFLAQIRKYQMRQNEIK